MKKRMTLICAGILMITCLCSCSRLMRQEKEPAQELPAPSIQDEVPTPTTEGGALELNQYALTLVVGETAQLEVTPADGLILQWRSSNESVVLVNSQGLITAVGEGVANITCADTGSNAAVCTVTVSAPTTQAPTATVPTEIEPDTGAVFPHSSDTYLTEEEIAHRLANYDGDSPTGNYAQDAINEIYARHGYVFQNNTIRAFYEAKDWYVADSGFSMGDLNACEKANIELLKTFK